MSSEQTRFPKRLYAVGSLGGTHLQCKIKFGILTYVKLFWTKDHSLEVELSDLRDQLWELEDKFDSLLDHLGLQEGFEKKND